MLIYYETPFIASVADLLIAQTCEVNWQAKEEATMGYILLFGINLFGHPCSGGQPVIIWKSKFSNNVRTSHDYRRSTRIGFSVCNYVVSFIDYVSPYPTLLLSCAWMAHALQTKSSIADNPICQTHSTVRWICWPSRYYHLTTALTTDPTMCLKFPDTAQIYSIVDVFLIETFKDRWLFKDMSKLVAGLKTVIVYRVEAQADTGISLLSQPSALLSTRYACIFLVYLTSRISEKQECCSITLRQLQVVKHPCFYPWLSSTYYIGCAGC